MYPIDFRIPHTLRLAEHQSNGLIYLIQKKKEREIEICEYFVFGIYHKNKYKYERPIGKVYGRHCPIKPIGIFSEEDKKKCTRHNYKHKKNQSVYTKLIKIRQTIFFRVLFPKAMEAEVIYKEFR